MSGLKYSRIELEKEKKARQEALARIKELQSTIAAIREKMASLLTQIPEGVKKAFTKEVASVKGWQSQALPAPSDEMNSSQLKTKQAKLQQIIETGEQLLFQLLDIKERRREEKARALIKDVDQLDTKLKSSEILIKKWMPGEFEKYQDSLNQLIQLIDRGDFIDAETKIQAVQKEIDVLKNSVETLEYQNNQRHIVLDALRKVCKDMGWAETSEPHLEDPKNLSSPLIFEVNTYSSGKMKFYLTLTEIRVDSPFSTTDNFCIRQFDNVSEKLKNFGVNTKFERVDQPDEEPKLIQRGELGLPDTGEETEGYIER